jgi:hypothetical protein
VSHPLAEQAERGLKDATSARGKSQCQKWQRQQVFAVYGPQFEKFRRDTAHNSALAWGDSEYARPGGSWGAIGDIFYWYGTDANPAGHTAIRIAGNCVAENSIVHYKNVGDGRGTRPLSALRKPNLIVRLPVKKSHE